MNQGAAGCRAIIEETDMTWETPAYCEIRLGFEVTAYVYVR
ncbi:pyrroloquinoline quinone precursor peptide PqqA [Aromatoleum bremense]|nr:Coenzyme PQQ biosynthesis protein [Aromatoleum bremense]